MIYKNGSVRQSLNQLRVSLNRSLIFPQFDTDMKEEVNIDEHDVKDLQLQFDVLHSSSDDEFSMAGCEADMAGERYASCQEDSENEEEMHSKEPETDAFSYPALSDSPKVGNAMRKSAVLSQDNAAWDSLKISNSLKSSKMFVGPNGSLAASLQRGLEIIDNHQKSSVFDRSLGSFSFDHLATNTNDASVLQTSGYICSNCKERASNEVRTNFSSGFYLIFQMQIIKFKLFICIQVAAENIKKLKDLENLCTKQAAEIEKLNNLVRLFFTDML